MIVVHDAHEVVGHDRDATTHVVFLRNRDKAVALWDKKWGKAASE